MWFFLLLLNGFFAALNLFIITDPGALNIGVGVANLIMTFLCLTKILGD